MTKIDEFINRSELLHNNKYDYSLTEYIKSSEKVSIICKEHGIFQQTPNNHLRGQGYRKCVIDNQKSNTNDFIKKSIEIHGYIVKSIWEKDFKLINKIKYRYNV